MNHSPITRIYPGQQTFSVTQAAAILGVHWTTVWRRAKSRPGQAEGIDIHIHSYGDRGTRLSLDAFEAAIKSTVESPEFTQACARLGARPAFLPADQFGSLIARQDMQLAQLMEMIRMKK